MKECTYGWYPPAKEVMKTYCSEPRDSYHDECLYRHSNSKYTAKHGVSPPITPEGVRLSLRSRPPSKRSLSMRAESVAPPYDSPCRADPVLDRPDSRSISVTPTQVFKPHTPKPPSCKLSAGRKAWSLKLTETPISINAPPCAMDYASMQPQPTPPPSAPSAARSNTSSRAKSATLQRARTSAPARSIKSADPAGRASRTPVVTTPAPPATRPASTESEPSVKVIPPWGSFPEIKEEVGVDEPLDYDEQLEKYGWRMEIPGDPFNIKRACLAKRMSTTVKVAVPVIPPNPPKAKGVTWDTFFYNTIPRRPATFTIHKEWLSETLAAKRVVLQKKDGDRYKYRHTDYGFVY